MIRILFLVLAVALCAGCTTVPAPVLEAPPAPDPRTVLIFDGRSGELLSWHDLVAAACSADVVLIGELHDHPLGLPVAAALWDDVLAATGRAALSLEFFARDDQSRIDDYLKNLTDESTFRRRTGRTERNYPPAHSQMLEAARAAGRPVYASNAPRAIVRLVNRFGFDRIMNLTAEQQRLVRIPDYLPTGRYREVFEEQMRTSLREAHGIDDTDDEIMERMIEGIFRGQVLWDWTMVDSIARAVESGDQPVVHVVGRFHTDFDGGLIQALQSLLPGARTLALSMAPRWSESLREDDVERADVVIYIGPSEPAS